MSVYPVYAPADPLGYDRNIVYQVTPDDACVALFAHAGVSSAVFQAPLLMALTVFTPPLAGWSILVGIAVSARARDVRVAQQITTFASFPPVAVAALMSFRVIAQSLPAALGLAAGLVLIDSNGLTGRVGDV